MSRHELVRMDEWKAILAELHEMQNDFLEALLSACNQGVGMEKQYGRYDGFRLAVRYLEDLGVSDVQYEEEEGP